jgi:hypothetical protein
MEFKAVRDFLAQATAYLTGSPEQQSVAGEVSPHVDSSSHSDHHDSGRKTNKRAPRHVAETEIVLARAGKSGYFKVSSVAEKVVFNIWVSDHYTNRRGEPMRKIFPKVHYRNGEVVARITGQGLGLPMSILYGKPVDLRRFPEKDRELLTQFADAIARGIAQYDCERESRISMRAAQ